MLWRENEKQTKTNPSQTFYLPILQTRKVKIFTKIQTRRVQKQLVRFVGAQPRCLDYMRENLQGTHPYHGQGNPGDLGGKLTIQPCFLRTYLANEGSHITFFVDAQSRFYLAAIFKVCRQMGRGLEMRLLVGLEQSEFWEYPIACGKSQMATMKTHPKGPRIDKGSNLLQFKSLLCTSKACQFVITTGLFIMIRSQASVVFFFLLTKLPNLLNR